MSTYVSPRIHHNADLTTALIAKLKVTGRFPRVTDQVPTVPLDLKKLVRFGYNMSILENEGCLLAAYRYHDGDTLATKLALAQVSFEGEVISNRTLEMGDGSVSVEDPKLFRMNDEVWISWVQSTWPTMPLSAVVKYGRLDGNKVVNVEQVEPLNPKPIEKNHVIFSWLCREICVYESEPEQIVYELLHGKVIAEHRSPAPSWNYGSVRGGTPPILYKGKLLRFFHSGLDNEFDGWHRRYFLGAALMDCEPPFSVVAISSRPIIFGAEQSEIPTSARPAHFKGRVVFPGGAVERNGEFLLSVGINDSACAILRISPDKLNL